MRTLKFVLAALVALIILILAIANGADVSVKLWPDLTDYAVPAAPSVSLPLFIVGLSCGLVGFLLGAAREWAREGKIRSTARHARKEAAALKAKVDELTKDSADDDIPALPSR
ncbi:MAG: LapA family protein [Pseudomonadota bacterium]